MNIEIVIQPEMFAVFKEISETTNIEYKITTENLQG
jgi:hypothetical protein